MDQKEGQSEATRQLIESCVKEIKSLIDLEICKDDEIDSIIGDYHIKLDKLNNLIQKIRERQHKFQETIDEIEKIEHDDAEQELEKLKEAAQLKKVFEERRQAIDKFIRQMYISNQRRIIYDCQLAVNAQLKRFKTVLPIGQVLYDMPEIVKYYNDFPTQLPASIVTANMYHENGGQYLAKNSFMRDFYALNAPMILEQFGDQYASAPFEFKLSYLGFVELEMMKTQPDLGVINFDAVVQFNKDVGEIMQNDVINLKELKQESEASVVQVISRAQHLEAMRFIVKNWEQTATQSLKYFACLCVHFQVGYQGAVKLMSDKVEIAQFKSMLEHYNKQRNAGYTITSTVAYQSAKYDKIIQAAYLQSGFKVPQAQIKSCMTLNLFKRYGEFLMVNAIYKANLHRKIDQPADMAIVITASSNLRLTMTAPVDLQVFGITLNYHQHMPKFLHLIPILQQKQQFRAMNCKPQLLCISISCAIMTQIMIIKASQYQDIKPWFIQGYLRTMNWITQLKGAGDEEEQNMFKILTNFQQLATFDDMIGEAKKLITSPVSLKILSQKVGASIKIDELRKL